MIIKATVKFYTRLSSRIKVVFDSNGKFGKIENEILLPTCQSAIELKIGVNICEQERCIGTMPVYLRFLGFAVFLILRGG
jgi:hypothetical protein